jgi:CRISPR-associated protein (TIGR03986 family)
LARVLGCYERASDGQPLRQIAGNDSRDKGKKHELLLPYQAGRFKKLAIPAAVIERFQQLADQMTEDSKREAAPRPYEPKDTRPGRKPGDSLEPKEGDLVFFDVDDRACVTEISYSSIWRGRVSTDKGEAANAWTFFEAVDRQLAPFHSGRTHVTLVERVLGFVEEKDGQELRNGLRLKGRVRFSPGLALGEVPEMPLTPLKELSSPKPPSPSLYFRKPQGDNAYIAKSELKPAAHWPQGRKIYLHHPNAITRDTKPWMNQGTFVPDRHVKVRPWAKGAKWRFEIRFDNLNDVELGLLLYALCPSDEFGHKIGMGKPLGLGSVRITIEHVRLVDRETRYSADGWDRPRYSEDLAWQALRNQYRTAMSAEIRAALEEVGDPGKLDAKVHITYPRVIGQEGEEDLYQWFVANDQQRDSDLRVALQPVALTRQGRLESRVKPLPRLPPPRL